MKRVAILMAVLALAAGCDDDSPTQPSNTGPIVFTAQLSAANEVPPVTNAESSARGTATITFDVPRDSTGAITGGGNATFAIQLNSFPASSTPVDLPRTFTRERLGPTAVPWSTTCQRSGTDLLSNGAANAEHHRHHHAGTSDEHHRGAGEFLFQRAHDR